MVILVAVEYNHSLLPMLGAAQNYSFLLVILGAVQYNHILLQVILVVLGGAQYHHGLLLVILVAALLYWLKFELQVHSQSATGYSLILVLLGAAQYNHS